VGFLASIRTALGRPSLFEKVDESFWREDYIAEQILEAHLDPANDDASRRAPTIARSSEWISRLVKPGSRLLDLGCGPGLYCTAFHRRGLEVTGMDYSSVAIDYARRQAQGLDYPIVYLLADYRAAELPSPFDIVTLIYGGLGCISDAERDDLLARIHRALAPGGLFVFDVFSEHYIERTAGSWYVKLTEGFWRPGPHLVVERKYEYPHADTHLDRYIVVDLKNGVIPYNLWKHYYTKESMEGVLAYSGFTPLGWYGDLAGSPFHPRGMWIGVVAAKA